MQNTRRQFIQKMGILGAVGVTAGLTACNRSAQSPEKSDKQDPSPKANPKHAGDNAVSAKHCTADIKYAFYDDHQAGILTPVQRHVYFLVVDLHSTNIDDIRQMFQDWTQYAVKLMNGENIKDDATNPHIPPTDTGEAEDLSAYGLTLTFGVSPTFFDKLGLAHKKPAELSQLPKFPKDQIRETLSGGDICIQACSEDPQVAFHAVRQLVRQARALITMKWSQMGYNSFDTGKDTPRNLFGFKDGTANSDTLQDTDKWLWIDNGVFKNGTYLITRVIQMHLETWDRTSLKGQEDTFGRHKKAGAPLGQTDEFVHLDVNAKDQNGALITPADSHVGLAKRTGLQILRRSYSYSSGINDTTGQFDTGLLFISFQKNPMQFNVMQNALGRVDKMNEYVTHIGSGVFVCFGGVKKGEYLGQSLFE